MYQTQAWRITVRFVFLCFCKRKMEKRFAYTLLNQQMNHLLIIIYIIGTHTCFHKNTKTQKHKGTVKREDSQIYLRKTKREFLRWWNIIKNAKEWVQNTKLAWGYAERRSISMMGHQNTKKCCYFIVSLRVIFLTKKKPLLFSAKIPAILWGMSDKTKYNLRSSCRICVISVPLGHS